ncbi:4'-phosphopantetheinyl transferase superfamily protein [Dietzia sp. B19]|uniref:4'-phosphopantetheinyl transferase family protein n=1 Tax=Dietzia sp. B19 TaxID=1630632 RepID=UPI0015FA3743|nr:4'-phosphopantetheinyl transferase superfamily protein [Dietzia sp. B19]MBB1055975.1 4'-phosphopantetheinyl transferase superfamily protein [Dietzia sp. B19]
MFDLLLPSTVRTAQFTGNVPEDEVLFPDEIAHLVRAVPKRRAEFTTVRHCARLALAQVGHERPSMVPAERGAPRWPPGIVGSMTHCDRLRAAAVARAEDLAGLGIDAEIDAALPDGVVDTIALPGEIRGLSRVPTENADRVLFSAKESVYKVWYPLMRTWLDFDEAEIVLESDGGLHARLLVEGPVVGGRRVQTLHGRWSVRDGVVGTAVWLPAPPR